MKGTLYGVSIGPGDPELMTLKAVKIINKCEIIAVPQTKGENTMALSIAEKVCDLRNKTIVYLDFFMTRDKKLLYESHKEIAEKLYPYLENEKSIAFLNIGDISVYSTFSYIAELLEDNGFIIEVCPGVTSFCAAAAVIKKPLVQGEQALIVMPSSNRDFELLLSSSGTKVIMKSNKNIEDIKQKISENGSLDDFYGIENCGLKNQRIYKSIADIKESCGYFTTIIINSKQN